MIRFIRDLTKGTFIFPFLKGFYGYWNELLEELDFRLRGTASLRKQLERAQDRKRIEDTLVEWKKRGRPVPAPSCFKQKVVMDYGKRFGLHTLVETGTYRGEMVYAAKDAFSRIYSIELSRKFYERAKSLFSGYGHITIYRGDSSAVLPKILESADEPCLFWLDAHYSGGDTAKGESDTPIWAELESIAKHKVKGHVILIDDARDFTGKNGYPTLKELEGFCKKRFPKHSMSVEDDIIRITPVA